MRDRKGEGFEFPVRGFELYRALLYPLFEFQIELADILFRLLVFGHVLRNHGDTDDLALFSLDGAV